MPGNLQLIKRRIRTANNIFQIAKAMETIAASKIKRAKKSVEANKPYTEKITNMVENILNIIDTENYQHPFLIKNQSEKKLIITIGTDRGLCGILIPNLLKKLLNFDTQNTYMITIGKKIARAAVKLDFELIASFPMGSSLPKYSVIYPVLEIINQYYINKKISEVYILFTEFKSFFTQTPTIQKLLPVEIKKSVSTEYTNYIFEPEIEIILKELLPYYVEVKLYNTIINSYTSEQAARMVSMQKAKNNALDVSDSLTLIYNKIRQEKITNEILDITNTQ